MTKLKFFLLDLNAYSHMSYGLLCLADAVGEAGHQVVIGGRPRSLASAANTPEEIDFVLQGVKAAAPDILGLSAFSTTAFALKSFIPRLKQQLPSTPIVVGGPHCLLEKERVLDENPLADFGFFGEAEDVFPDFLSRLSGSGQPYRDIPGLIFREQGAVKCNAAPPPTDFARFIPARAFQRYTDLAIFGMDQARESPVGGQDAHLNPLCEPTLSVLLSRGCPYRCTFCHMPCNPYNMMRYLSPDAFQQQLELVLGQFPFRSLFIHDASFDVNKPWARKIMRIIKDSPQIIDWACQLRPNLVTEDFVGEIVDAGCRAVGLYLENAVERIRNDELNKQVTQQELERAYEVVERHNLFVRVNVILGSPGESIAEVAENITFLEQHPPGQGRFLRLAVLPGTELHDRFPDRRFIENSNIDDQLYSALRFIMDIHYSPLAIRLRKVIPVAGKSILVVHDEPVAESGSNLAEFVWIFSLPSKPPGTLPARLTFLLGPNSESVGTSLPPNTNVLQFSQHPLAIDPDEAVSKELKALRYHYLLLASDHPSEATLDGMVLLANRLGIPKIAVVNRRQAVIFEYDVFSKSLSRHQFCLNFSSIAATMSSERIPMSDESVDFQLLRRKDAE